MTDSMKAKCAIMKKCVEEVKKFPIRVGESVYVRIERDNQFRVLDIKSAELHDFMFKELFDQEIMLDEELWRMTKKYILGEHAFVCNQEQKIRMGKIGESICYDILDFKSSQQHYIQISKEGWKTVEGNLDEFEWNRFQLPQTLPERNNGNVKRLYEYLNLNDDDKLMFMVYLISCYIPHIQHPILNISGEAGTGKSTLSKMIKELVDPSQSMLNDFSDGEDGIRLPLSLNYLTVFDNVELLPKKLNAVFCRAVTGGDTIKRKHYTNNEMVSIPLKSIVVMNGITSAIRREDLLSRTIFVETKSLRKWKRADEMWTAFMEEKSIILAGIFDTLVKAMNLIEEVQLEKSYRMMEFMSWGYAIAEALGQGNGARFCHIMENNARIQLQETYANEPLVSLISRYMDIHHGETVCTETTKFFNKLMKEADNLLGQSSYYSKRLLPQTPQTFTKKVNSLKSVFQKMGINIEIDRTRDVRNLSQITIAMENEEESEETQNGVNKQDNEVVLRIPITGIRKPIIMER